MIFTVKGILDCQFVLTDASFPNPLPFPYDPVGSGITVATSYLEIF